MDGTAIIALFIVIMFFASYPRQVKNTAPAPTPPAVTSEVKTETTQPAVTPPPAQPQTAEQPSNYYIDNSPAPYQYVSYDRMDAIIRKYNKNMTVADADRLKLAVDKYCKEKDIDPRLVLAVMARESGFKPEAVSTSGAIGLGQIMPFNYEQLGISDPHDIDQNTKGVVYYLKEKLNDWVGQPNQVGLGIASYLKGTGDIKRAGATYSGHTETYVNDILRIRGQI